MISHSSMNVATRLIIVAATLWSRSRASKHPSKRSRARSTKSLRRRPTFLASSPSVRHPYACLRKPPTRPDGEWPNSRRGSALKSSSAPRSNARPCWQNRVRRSCVVRSISYSPSRTGSKRRLATVITLVRNSTHGKPAPSKRSTVPTLNTTCAPSGSMSFWPRFLPSRALETKSRNVDRRSSGAYSRRAHALRR